MVVYHKKMSQNCFLTGMEDSLQKLNNDDENLTEISPKVSIVVPVYNTEKYLEKCLKSLIGQTLKDIEIICVNDGSTDKSSEILQKFADSDTRIKIITQSNQKQGVARNRGMEVALGEYIGFVDSDDWIDSDYFEKLYSSARKYDSDIALATNIRIGNGKTKKRLNIKDEVFVTSLQRKIDISHQVKNPCPTNKIYRRAMLNTNNITWPEGVYCEDKLFTIKAIYYANGLVTVPDVNYYYYRNPNSTVNSKKKGHFAKKEADKINAKKAVLEFLKEKKAEIRDKEFWALKKEVKVGKFSIYKIIESLHTEKFILLSFIKIFEKRV